MRLTVLGACGAWPGPGQACSGFLLEYQGFQLAIDLGYATVPKLFELTTADRLDAVFISHGHPDHCADLNPLLRARALGSANVASLPVYALPGALDAVLALDRPGMLAKALDLREIPGTGTFNIGPLKAETGLLPHWVPNAGLRITAGGVSVAYTGDSGPDPGVVRLAAEADLFIAEATYPGEVPEDSRAYLTNAPTAARQASAARAKSLLLTHLWPGSDPAVALAAAAAEFGGPLAVATAGLAIEL